MTKSIQTLLVISLFSSVSAFADRSWNDANNPSNLESNYLYQFSLLPKNGTITDSNKGWSDSYWPATRGYIADRWQIPGSGFSFKDYDLPTPERISSMSPSEINLLSPAEKFDIIRNKLDLPLITRLRKANPTDGDWWRGLCNGWTQASLNFNEPMPIVYTSRLNGIKVPLGSSDIKALMAYYYAQIDRTSYNSDNKNAGYIGKACRVKDRILLGLTGACSDMNAGAFHIALTNELGIRHRGVAMDRDPDTEVWNQPFVGFETRVLSVRTSDLAKNKTDGTVKEVTVSTTVKYVNELYDTNNPALENDKHVSPRYEALGKGNQHYGIATYEYVLELDSADRIIGGDWTGGDPHPDFMWRQAFNPEGMARDTRNYVDDWTILSDIVKLSTQY
jgi:hypothetical protein